MANKTGDMIGYIFSFPDAGAAARDPVVGQYFFMNMDFYDTLVNSVTPFPGFFAMVNQTYPLVPALQTHPNVVLIRNQSILEPTVLVNNGLPDLAFLMIIAQGFCTYVVRGLQLQPVPPPPPPPPGGGSEPFPVVF